jgi:hypothetical protein
MPGAKKNILELVCLVDIVDLAGFARRRRLDSFVAEHACAGDQVYWASVVPFGNVDARPDLGSCLAAVDRWQDHAPCCA